MKTKIHTIDSHGCWHYVIEGTPIVIPGYEEYSFLFHKLIHDKGYGITEVTTGIQLFPFWEHCKNKAVAITTTQNYLNRYDKHGEFGQILQNYLDDHNNGKPINIPKKRVRKIRQKSLGICLGQMKLFPELEENNE